MVIDSGASLTVVRPDVTAGLPERYKRTPETLKMVADEILPVLKETLVKSILWRRLLTKLRFVAKITYEFILGLNVLSTHAASVDLLRRVL
jgi:hypothetical protein